MARTKYPPIKVTATRQGLTPPHLMSPEERREWAIEKSILFAKRIGAVPSKELLEKQSIESVL